MQPPTFSDDYAESTEFAFNPKTVQEVMEFFNISCIDVQVLYPDHVDKVPVKIIFGIAYFCVFVCGIVGNLLTAYCVLALHVNVGIDGSFVLSFVCSNLTIAFLSLPFTAHHIFAREWLLGDTLCKLVPFFQMTGTFVSSFTLAAIAVDRYRNVACRRVYRNRGVRLGPHLFVVMALWSISFGASFPYAYSIMNLLSYQNVCGNFCEELWPTEIHRRSSSFAIVVLQFALPMAILWYCYGCLRKTFSTSIRRREQYSLTQDSYDRMRRNRSKTSTLTILLCAAFVGPWLPMNIVHIMRDFTVMPQEYDLLIFATVHLIAMTSTMWNPLIYCGLNRDFLAAVTSILHCRKMASKAFISEYNRSHSHCPNLKRPSNCSRIELNQGVDV